MNNERGKPHRPLRPQGFCLCLTASISHANEVLVSLLKRFSVNKGVIYLDVASVGGAKVRYSAAMDGHHGDRGYQGVSQLFVPELQPLDKLGHLQAVLALFAFMDSLVRVAVV